MAKRGSRNVGLGQGIEAQAKQFSEIMKELVRPTSQEFL
jgi:hypothetical protein